MAKLLACVALLCLAAAGTAEEDGGLIKRGNKKEKLFFGSYRTITNTGVTLTTSTVYASCVSGYTTDVCMGRKKRNVADRVDIVDEESPDSIDSSLIEESESVNR